MGLGREPGQAASQAGAESAERQAYLERLRRAAGTVARDLASATTASAGSSGQVRRIAIALPANEPDEAEAVALGSLLGGYAFRKYRTTAAVPGDVEQIVHTAHEDAIARARILAEAMTLVRDLVNTAPADLVPADLAAAAEQVAAAHGLGVQVLDENDLAKEGFGGILAVGMGSTHPPRLVRLEYTHPDAARHRRVRRQGHHLRLRRPVAQAAEVDGDDEVRHERRRRRAGRRQAIAELGPAGQRGRLPLRSPRTCRAAPRSGRRTSSPSTAARPSRC